MSKYILTIDQGTSSTRAIIFNSQAAIVQQHQIELAATYPNIVWVEQDPEQIWRDTQNCCHEVIKKSGVAVNDVVALGISNQRETTIIWNKSTGTTIYPAIVWQDRRTSKICETIASDNIAKTLHSKTGLLLDPYFSATKIMWILDNIPGARVAAEKGELAFGTVDSFLLWKFTDGKVHATDATNASRTLLFNIQTQAWDTEILRALDIPHSILPTVRDSSDDFGVTDVSIFGIEIPITAMAGDQQAAAIGQACFEKGMVKSTYGTGCFILLNTGAKLVLSDKQLLSTVAYRLNGKVTYGLEGSIFSAGITIKWLRDTLKYIQTTAETESLAKSIPDTNGVYFVPAFTGLGAPYWNAHAKAALLGLTLESSKAQIVRAALEAVCYQTRDLLTLMSDDLKKIRVDGGMAANNWLLQFLADILHVDVQRPTTIETSALGVAFLAGLKIGLFKSLEQISQLWQEEAQFKPAMQKDFSNFLYQGWQDAVARVK